MSAQFALLLPPAKMPMSHRFIFFTDYHALIKCQEPEKVRLSSLEIAATWLALGLDTSNAVFYRQSDVPEIMELTWMLTCVTAKGLMNRAHAYKASVADNEHNGENDPDKGITMGLFSYPVLMAADILMFNAHKVPVGKDQIQHIEMARALRLVLTISTANILCCRKRLLMPILQLYPDWMVGR